MLVDDDAGRTIQVRVTSTDDGGNREALTSAATEAVAQAPPPLTVSLRGAAPAAHDGSEAIPEAGWTPIPYWMDGAADVAETTYTPLPE